MDKYQSILLSLSSFVIVSILFLIILNITLNIIIKKFDIEKIRIYGMFLNMNKNTIISFSLTTLTYIMFIWILIDLHVNYVFVASIISMSVLANLLADDFPYGFLNLLNTISCIIAICFIEYINKLIIEDSTMLMIIVKWFVILFLFLYLTYVTLINLNRLLEIEKIRVIKDKRGNQNES